MPSRPRRRIAALVALCVAPTFLGALRVPSSATFPGRNGELAFARLAEGSTVGIWVMSASGTSREILTGTERVARDPAWSPDGGTIAFVGSISHGPEELFTMSEDGTHVVRITHNDQPESRPCWSADGRWITYMTLGDRGGTRIDEIRPDGTQRRLVARVDGGDPDWSPDGSRIAFDADGQIHTMLPRGRGVRQVTTEGGFEPSWSPNRRWIVFVNAGDVFKVHPDGSQLRRLSSTAIDETWPSWSPNGERIVYLRTRSNDERSSYLGAIWSMRADGSSQQRLMRRVSGDQIPLEAPDWQPRGAG